MIELMLEAERALAVGLLDKAESHYQTVVTSDPRNAIAIVGLARVALERGDQLATYMYARKALAIDPDNPAASHLVHRMGEQLAMRGEAVPDGAPAAGPAGPDAAPVVAAPQHRAPGAAAQTDPAPTDRAPAAAGETRPTARPSLLDRIRGRGR